MNDRFGARALLDVGGTSYEIFRLDALADAGFDIDRLPYSMRVLLENLLRTMDGRVVRPEDVEAVARWEPKAEPSREISFTPSRVLLQDFTGVPAVVDLAAMRDAMAELEGTAERINPLQPAELVIDHSVQVDEYGSSAALLINAKKEFERNRERYLFLRWGQRAFRNFRVVPPATGIVHQVNLEYLARVVFATDGTPRRAYPDTLIGTDSHTTMINGLGVLGWGVGGIEAEAAMLGQPVSMLVPQVVGFHLSGTLPEGATATDLVLVVTEMLRKKGVVGKFVEFYGPGLDALPVADRATIANMAPEYGATCGIFPIDRETLRDLEFTGRTRAQLDLIEAYAKKQGLFHGADPPSAAYSDTLSLDLGSVEPSLAGPRRPQDRVRLRDVGRSFAEALPTMRAAAKPQPVGVPLDGWEAEGGNGTLNAGSGSAAGAAPRVTLDGESFPLSHGAVVIAAITSCTNTSNPTVMVGAGLLAKRAVERGLRTKPWVKTSLAPGSKVVTEYLARAGLTPFLEALGFHTVGYGCTTCIGNSGPLPAPISAAIDENNLVVASVLSGNRNYEGRIHPEVRANYLASPPLVVAYALAGRIDIDLTKDPLGKDPGGASVTLRDLWPSRKEIDEAIRASVRSETFREAYRDVYAGDAAWRDLPVPAGDRYAWDPGSTYVKRPPYFADMRREPEPVGDVLGARVLAVLGDSVTTDHISPAGAIKKDSPAGRYLIESGVGPLEFNSYGSRRGNHEVMVRGTFANTRIRNKIVPGVEGGYTLHFPGCEQMAIYDAAMRYLAAGVPTIVIAGKEYGSGSSRDWAAKGPKLLGVRAVIAESFERIHRSNLIGMGILPLQFRSGENAERLTLSGREIYDVTGITEAIRSGAARPAEVTVRVQGSGGVDSFRALVRLDTPQEVRYYENGGILLYVLRRLLSAEPS
ncbi:MAG: aconitate hydratase AcnA [Candidatus Latescibacteria bacterium]|nr:aconitate hydratase AcnA [Candidatus Latescibacterota bacterium]